MGGRLVAKGSLIQHSRQKKGSWDEFIDWINPPTQTSLMTVCHNLHVQACECVGGAPR